MTQIAEQITFDGNNLIVKETHDFTPIVDRAKALQSAGMTSLGESRHVGDVPLKLLEIWLKEAGVKMSDRKAVEEVLKRKLMSGEFSQFRVWEGRF
jgi:hypothetical protein